MVSEERKVRSTNNENLSQISIKDDGNFGEHFFQKKNTFQPRTTKNDIFLIQQNLPSKM